MSNTLDIYNEVKPYHTRRVVEVIIDEENPQQQALILEELDGKPVYIPYSEIFPNYGLKGYIGRGFNFRTQEVLADRIIGSGKAYKAYQRQRLLEKVAKEPNRVFNACVIKKMNYGVYLDIEGVTVFLENLFYSKNPIRVCDHVKLGDLMPVQVIESYGKKICVKAVNMNEPPYPLTRDDFEVNQIILGLVRSVKEDKVFVCLGHQLDSIAPHSPYFGVAEGDLVAFKLKQIKEDGRLRGKMVRNLSIEKEEKRKG